MKMTGKKSNYVSIVKLRNEQIEQKPRIEDYELSRHYWNSRIISSIL